MQSFARWRQINPSKSILEDARRYRYYLESHDLYTIGSRNNRCHLVDEFCGFLADNDQIEMYSIRDKVLGRAELQALPAPVVDGKEMARFLRLQAKKGWQEYRDAVISVLAYSCILGPSEIASLQHQDVRIGMTDGYVRVSGRSIPMSMLTIGALHVFLRGIPQKSQNQPLFPRSRYDLTIPMTSPQVRSAMAGFAKTYGYDYDEMFSCSPQLAIAQHIEALSPIERKILGAQVISMYFGSATLDSELFTRAPGNLADSLWQ